MKTQSKPIVALASGAVLLCGVLTQSAHAQIVDITSGTGILADVDGNATGPTALPVQYSVTENTVSDVYTYSYVLSNPGPASGAGAYEVDSVSLSFDASQTGVVLPGSLSGGILAVNNGENGVAFFFAGITGGNNSGTLTFNSEDAPTMGDANANGDSPPGPWASSPDGTQIAVPMVVPEPTSLSLLALGVLVPAFRRGRNFFK